MSIALMRILKAPRDDSTKVSLSLLGAVHILRNTGWGGRGVPDLLQYYIGGVFKVYYNITDLVGIWKGSGHFQYYIYIFM